MWLIVYNFEVYLILEVDILNELFISDLWEITPIGISILALLVSIYALRLNKINYITQSYYQNGSYKVFFVKLSCLDKILSRDCFEVKVSQSVISDSYVFPYYICITPNVGGIERAQLFDIIDNGGIVLGTCKTRPIIRNKFKKFNFFNKQYAHSQITSFGEVKKYPYFIKNYNDSGLSLSRYHFCIEITDFRSNTEIWYVSFSLVLDKDDVNYVVDGKFDDLNIVSQRDLVKNMNMLINFNETLDDIFKKDNIDDATYSLQLFEMKEYLNFLVKLKQYL